MILPMVVIKSKGFPLILNSDYYKSVHSEIVSFNYFKVKGILELFFYFGLFSEP